MQRTDSLEKALMLGAVWTHWYRRIAKRYHYVMEWFDPLCRMVESKPIKFWWTSAKKENESWSWALLSGSSKRVGPIACWDHRCYVMSADRESALGSMSSRQVLHPEEFPVNPEQRKCSNSGLISQGDLFEGNFTYLQRELYYFCK